MTHDALDFGNVREEVGVAHLQRSPQMLEVLQFARVHRSLFRTEPETRVFY
jgi:hypothetical protein